MTYQMALNDVQDVDGLSHCRSFTNTKQPLMAYETDVMIVEGVLLKFNYKTGVVSLSNVFGAKGHSKLPVSPR